MAYYPDSPDRVNEESRDALDNIQSNFQHLEEIAENIPEILDGSIVDDNLDDDNPSNGYFSRTKNGKQVCWHGFYYTYEQSDRITANWSFPASFVDDNDTIQVQFRNTQTTYSGDSEELGINFYYSESTNGVSLGLFRIKGQTDFSSGDKIFHVVFAEGRWK